ncbi:MAG: hypothetical protein ABI831_09935 [Betaproteobacteria bacterium]
MHRSHLSAESLFAALALLLCCSIAQAAPGDADPSFGGTGYVRYAAPKSIPGLFAAGLGLDDGSVIVAGGADADVFVRRYRPDGSIDDQFGSNGTTIVPGFPGGGRSIPPLQLLRDSAGGVLLERAGKVRRLTLNGAYDSTYLPATMNIDGRQGVYSLLPQPDGRFVVVTGQQSSTVSVKISARFFLRDGNPDTTRGDANGERLVYPGGIGTYTDAPVSAVNDPDGKILIMARWDKGPNDSELVLIRLNSDGAYDSGFGTGGVAVVGSLLGAVGAPQVAVGRDGRIAVLFSVPPPGGSEADPYFVVYVLLPNGQQDVSASSAGRISVVLPRQTGVNLFALRWLSGSPELMVAGVVRPEAFSGGDPSQPTRFMLWRANLDSGTVGAPEYSGTGPGKDFALRGFALAGNRWLWGFGGEDSYVYGRVGVAPLTGVGRGVLLAFDTQAFAAPTPARIVATFSGRYAETFDEAKALSNGKLLVLGRYNFERQTYPALTLTQFTADGQLDPGYANGAGRVRIGNLDGGNSRFVPSKDDRATVLNSLGLCGLTTCFYRASLLRYTTAGALDSTFGTGGSVALTPLNEQLGTNIVPGFVDAQGATTLVRIADTIQPLRYTATGTVDATFAGAAQAAPPATQLQLYNPARIKLEALADGRLQAVVADRGAQLVNLYVYRWLPNGPVDPTFVQNAPLSIATVDTASDADIDTLALADGRTLIAIVQTSLRILLRLRADGALDSTFGDGGFVRINDAPGYGQKLALEPGGKILLIYNTPLGKGSALAVARFTADGQRDLTFTADGRFDSLFSLSGNETGADLIVLPDGRLLAVGQSDGFGLLLKLRGSSSPAAEASSPVVEFFNSILGHYFITAGPGEIANIEAGGAGPGWQRTGYGFRAHVPESGVPAAALPVCRFYGTPGRGPNSHFYTVSEAECATVKLDPGWTYEGIAFYLYAPVNGQCGTGLQRVYRAYNNRSGQNDSNHRYATELTILQPLVGQGWTVEGTVFCAPQNLSRDIDRRISQP